MKKIALLLLVLFTAVQVVPAVQAWCDTGKVLVFNVDEEKHSGKQAPDDLKEKKFFADHFLQIRQLAVTIHASFQKDDAIPLSPCLEQLVPPPNFC